MSTFRKGHEDWCPARYLDVHPCACMRRQIDAALALHRPCHAGMNTHEQSCDCRDWRHLSPCGCIRGVTPRCVSCREHQYPCPTARALGVDDPSETTGDPT